MTARFQTLLKFLTCCLLMAFGATSSFGQEPGDVMLRFVAFPKIPDPQPVQLLGVNGSTINVELSGKNISSPYKVKMLPRWVLGKATMDETSKPSFKAYGETPALQSPKQLILVVRNGPADEDGYKMIPFDDREDGFAGGSYICFNASVVNIAGQIGDAKFGLKPLSYKLIAPNPSKVSNDRKYLYNYFYYAKEDKLEPFYSSTWRYSEQARSMVFFYHDTNSKQLRIQTIRSFAR